ncbi:MAG: CvpA family protein [Bacteroidetes bacterium]|nr:CvpA family protein [Bacteroidota bacterium]
MNFIDIIICIPLVWGLYKGFTKGLIVEAATLVAFGLGVWGGIHFSGFIAKKIIEQFNWQSPYLPIISFAITFLGIVILVYFIAKLVQHMVEGMALGVFNKIGGSVFGALKFALVISVIIFIINAIEKSYPVISFKSKEGSVLYQPLGKVAPMLIPGMREKLTAEREAQKESHREN